MYYILVVIFDKMSEQQPHTQTNEHPPKKDLILEAMLSLPDIFGKVVKPVSTKPDAKQLLTKILGDQRLVEEFMNLCKTNIHELTPDAKELLHKILHNPYLFSEYVSLVSTDESLLTPDGIVLRNRFLQICPNIPNLL